MIRINQLKLNINHDEKELYAAAAKAMRIKPQEILKLSVIKRSLDARKKEEIRYIYSVDVELGQEKENKILNIGKNPNIIKAKKIEYQYQISGKKKMNHRPVVVGSGPAGLFCAYHLAKNGYSPLLIERGECVEDRIQTVNTFWAGGELKEDSNVQFGEGGAGTFSDGKLNTMVKDTYGRIGQVLHIFAEHGAPEEILYVNKPHIGTDYLRQVVCNIRNEIIKFGGEVRFLTKLVKIKERGGKVCSVFLEQKGTIEEIPCDTLVLAIGHSARDTFSMLYEMGIAMEAKAFAVGARIEHTQELISHIQYGNLWDKLPAADYKLTHSCANKRGIYSFCMCPGGFVVDASSESKRVVVNGMSNKDRSERNANSAMIVTVTPEDFRNETKINSPLAGIYFQQKFEELAYQAGQGNIPIQLFGDLLSGKESVTIGHIIPNIKGRYTLSDLRKCLPNYVIESLIEGITAFGTIIKGFADEEAVLSGVEMRTSSPVRLLRDETYMSINLKGLYPCGEGAGYAGGITSAAVDGLKVFEAIIKEFAP